MTGVLMKRGEFGYRDMHMGRTYVNIKADQVDVSRSQGMPKIACKPPAARGEDWNIFFLPAGTNPADTQTSDLKPPELCDDKLLWFKSLSMWYLVITSLAN